VHVQIKLEENGFAHGFAAHTDVVRAAVEAVVDALNKLAVTEKR